VKYVLRTPDQFAYMMLVVQSSSTIFLPVIQKLSVILGKRNTYFLGMSTLMLNLGLMFLIKEGQVVATYICAAVAGKQFFTLVIFRNWSCYWYSDSLGHAT
jgi:Na+/melibiose symporter-like transporter